MSEQTKSKIKLPEKSKSWEIKMNVKWNDNI